jgi:ribosome-associated protein
VLESRRNHTTFTLRILFKEESLDSITLARQIVDIVEDRQGSDILLLDVHELTSIAAYFIIATIDNERQAKAIEDLLQEKLKIQQDIRPLHAEGLGGQGGGWSLLDYGDVIVHLFTPETRKHYKLEELWSKAPVLMRML